MYEQIAKTRIFEAFQKVAPGDLSVSEAARFARVSANTASTYIRVLVAEGELRPSRSIGNARLFRIKDRKTRRVHNSERGE